MAAAYGVGYSAAEQRGVLDDGVVGFVFKHHHSLIQQVIGPPAKPNNASESFWL